MAANTGEDVQQQLLETMRMKCLEKGINGIKALGLVFRHLDKNYSSTLTFDEFQSGIHKFGIEFNQKELRLLFSKFDRDSNGFIDFAEFLKGLQPPLNTRRRSVVENIFAKLDVSGDDVLEVHDLRESFKNKVKKHPRFLSGEWSEDEALQHFLDYFDNPDCPDGKVTKDEFTKYYANVSATIDSDDYFDIMMKSSWGIGGTKK